MQLVLPWRRPVPRAAGKPAVLQVGDDSYPVSIARHRRARRFVLRMTPGGGLRLTVPRGASIADGLAFAKRQGPWIAGESARRAEMAAPWVAGTLVWFRGAQIPLVVGKGSVSLATETISISPGAATVRETVEAHLRSLAATELPRRCAELADLHHLVISRVSVRNQRTRWGSCSARGVIALNWRLIQMPAGVSDYVILHELMHLKQPNHSRQFWREVAAVCDGWRTAEHWLRDHGRKIL